MAILEVKELKKSFGNNEVLRGIDFSLGKGEILSIIGSLNWGLVGIFKFDLVAWLFGGQGAVFSRIIYTLVGLAGLWCISLLFRKGQHIEGE